MPHDDSAISPNDSPDEAPLDLGVISTRWSMVADVDRFVLRYTPAMESYLRAILRNEDDAREVLQSFVVKVIERGFSESISHRGRFRDYLTTSVRNAAISFLRKKQPDQLPDGLVEEISSRDAADDEAWRESWTQCLVDRAWHALERVEHQNDGNLRYTALRISVDSPELSSQDAAALASRQAGREVSPENYRKHLSRGRRQYAQLLINEVRETLDEASHDELVQEIAVLGLMQYVKKYLPDRA